MASRATIELAPEPQATAGRFADADLPILDDLETLARPVLQHVGREAGIGILQGILFLRLAEERGLEPFGALGRLAEGQRLGTKLATRLREAAESYEVSGLGWSAGMNGHRSARRSLLESAPDASLRDLLLRLYSDRYPGEVATTPADALGHLYERSLGKGDQESARKTHGAFYTPSYLVDYVVSRTVGCVLEQAGRDHSAPLRVLDPACGSGAFLLGAYRRLLDGDLAVRHEDGDPGYRRALRAALLENAIFGVDVDAAAVEVTKLSLLLACFDDLAEKSGQSEATIAQMPMPRLGRNLRAGHSLIDSGWGDAKTSAARARASRASGAVPARNDVLPFHWQREFPEVFADGGFDAVIGNPPYLSFGGRHAVDISGKLRRYYAEHYESGGWPTAHSLFLERSVKLLSRRFVSFVVPDQVAHLGGYRSARAIAQREAGLVEVRYWGERVFRGVTTPALTIVLDKEKRHLPTEVVDRDGASRRAVFGPGEPWSVSPAAALIERLRHHSFSLGKLVGDCGIRTTSSKEQVADWPGADGNVVPVLEGKLVDRYGCRPPRFAVRLDSPRPLFVSSPERYRAARFVIRQTASYPIVGPHEHALHFRNSLLALFSPTGGVDVHYLVALLNSKLMRFVYTETVREAHQRTFPQVKVKALQSLPLRELDLSRTEDRRRHDAIVELAMAALAAQNATLCASDADQARISRRAFEAIDGNIDGLVYDLYELSPDERDAVERSVARARS